MAAIEKFARIFAITVPAFLPREKPISRNAKPACMNMTSTPATITQVELMPMLSGMLFASQVSARAVPGSAITARAATAPMPSGHLLRATAPSVRLFIGVFPPVEARLLAHGDQRPRHGRRGPFQDLWTCVEDFARGVRPEVETPWTWGTKGPWRAESAPLAHRQSQPEPRHRDLEVAVRRTRRGRV